MATPRQKNKPKQSYGFQPVHGEARKTKEYWIWASIKSRCYGKNQKDILGLWRPWYYSV